MKDTPQSNTDWREDFYLWFTARKGKKDIADYFDIIISQLLEAEKKRWCKEVEGMREEIPSNWNNPPKGSQAEQAKRDKETHNETLAAVLQKLS